MMGGKYSAEWWEKIAGIRRETAVGHDPSHLVDDLIQATANGKSRPAGESEPGRAELATFDASLSREMQVE
jgi:hypothetical protein